MDDYIVRILAKEAGLRGLACVTTELVRESARRHDATPVAAAALGYGLTAAALLGALLKVQQRVAIKVAGDGPLKKMVVESDSYGHVRGYVAEPDVPSPLPFIPEDVTRAIGGQGILTVVKDLRLKDLYEGVVPLEAGPLDENLRLYLTRSEQIPSLVDIDVRLDGAGALLAVGGLLLQTLPGQDPAALDTLADRLDDLPPLAEMLSAGQTPDEVLGLLLADIDYTTLEQQPLVFRCSCSWARSKQALMLLGREGVESLLAEGEAVVDCHFCHERYVFGPEELETILEEMDARRV